jgi:phage terminase large subunit-like protein
MTIPYSFNTENPFDQEKYPNCYSGHQYAIDVALGKIPNCIYIVGACKRYLKDYSIYKSEEFPRYYFQVEKAEKYLRVVQKFEHVKGEWKTKNITYEPWQNFVFMNIVGWYDSMTGNRRFRIAHVEIPRGHGKSLVASQAALYFLAGDDSKGNTISCVATKKEQARIVLDAARAMAIKNKSFCKAKGVDVRAHNILQASTFSEIKALSSDKDGLDGLNDVLAICDELHAMSGEVFDLIVSGMSKRNDSLVLCITTAGFDESSVGFAQSEYAQK